MSLSRLAYREDAWKSRLGIPDDLPEQESPDLILGLEASVGRQLDERTQFWFGYRALAIEEDGEVSLEADFEEVIHGPAMGFRLRF